jgi:hypothetical protein
MNKNLNFSRISSNTKDEILAEEETIIDEEKYNLNSETNNNIDFFQGIIESKK